MRRYQFLYSLLITIGCVILQSTFLQKIAVYGVIPDLALIVVVFSSNSMGAMKGQGLGFAAGLVQDFLTTGPIGLNALIRTVVGYLFGKMKGKFFLDSILLPVIFIVVATLLKEILMSLLIFIFLPASEISFFGSEFLIELGLNAFIAPFVFALLKLIKVYRLNQKDGY